MRFVPSKKTLFLTLFLNKTTSVGHNHPNTITSLHHFKKAECLREFLGISIKADVPSRITKFGSTVRSRPGEENSIVIYNYFLRQQQMKIGAIFVL
jgi:hypothetical protein